MQAKPVCVTVGPFEVVHQAPQEVAFHRNAISCCALKLCQVIAQVHHAIGVIHNTVGSWYVRRGASILSNVNLFNVPDLRDVTWTPVESFWPNVQPRRRHVWIRFWMWNDSESSRRIVSSDIRGCINVYTYKIEWTGNDL